MTPQNSKVTPQVVHLGSANVCKTLCISTTHKALILFVMLKKKYLGITSLNIRYNVLRVLFRITLKIILQDPLIFVCI